MRADHDLACLRKSDREIFSIIDALAQMLVRVIRESFELVLNVFRKMAGFDYRVDNRFRSEFRIKVGDIENGFNRWLERWLDLLGK